MMPVCVLACAAVFAAVAPSPAGAATVAACADNAPALEWQVDRNSTGRDRSRRAISLRYANGGGSASVVKPISVTIVRGGKTRTVAWSSLQGEYRYRARKGERAGLMAVYSEDSSGYSRSTVGALAFLPVDLSGLFSGLVTPTLQQLQPVFGLLPPALQVVVPAGNLPGSYGGQSCARLQPLVVQEKAGARQARTFR